MKAILCPQWKLRLVPIRALVSLGMLMLAVGQHGNSAAAQTCVKDDSGLTLPAGFCATIFADKIGHTRHMAVGKDGTVYANTWSGRYFGNDKTHEGGFLVALHDSTGTGRADVEERFGQSVQSGGAGGTGIALHNGYVYAEINDRIERYALVNGSVAADAKTEIVVSGLPLGGDHPMHPFVIDTRGNLFVDVASATNACQVTNRTLESPGISPCKELETRGGVWKFSADKLGQKFSPAERYATGIRNADGLTLDPSNQQLYVTQHGRDQLGQNWPKLYTTVQGAILPSEVLLKVTEGADFGWPECYYDPSQAKLVLAPEYGGDGGKKIGECANKQGPVAAFPAHWAPNDVLIYSGKQFPSHYKDGAFIAFHGSWNRAPFAQGGFNVVFQPMLNGAASGKCEIFADGFAGGVKERGKTPHRPTGLAMAPDGTLYIDDDVGGRVYRVVYQGRSDAAPGKTTPCPPLDASPGEMVAIAASATIPAADLPVAAGSSKEAVLLGERIYHGQVGGAVCTGCHGVDAGGGASGPSLRSNNWVWSDGSFAGISKIVTSGVATPKNYPTPMPAMGGAQLSPEQVSAVSAYIWGLSHFAAK
jgi:glucose/arabinose dehydrogenase/mono/diheme cytochrome c family protein